MNAYKLSLYSLGFALLFGALCYVTYFPPKDGAAALVAYLYGALGTLAGHILGTTRAPRAHEAVAHLAAPVVPAHEGGFASVRLLALLAALALGLSLLAGCAGLNAQGALTITYNTPPTVTTSTFAPGGVAAALAPLLPPPAASAPAAPASAAK